MQVVSSAVTDRAEVGGSERPWKRIVLGGWFRVGGALGCRFRQLQDRKLSGPKQIGGPMETERPFSTGREQLG